MSVHIKFGRVGRCIGLMAATLLFAGGAAAAGNNVTNTKHNLSASGTGPNHADGTGADAGTGQICVFCHTPHGANTATGPLWNKKATGSTYTSYGVTIAGTTAADVGGVSLACLSCHDGSQAMDSMVNAPGPGGYDANGPRASTGAAGTVMGGTPVGVFGGDGKIGSGAANLGTDLSNDHPIGILYGGAACGSDGDDWKCYTAVGAGGAGYVGSGGRTRNKPQLYAGRDAFAGQPTVECGSCHDPHIEKDAADVKGDSSLNFMRVTTVGSALCLSCHTK